MRYVRPGLRRGHGEAAQTTTTAQTEVKAPVKLTFDTLEKTVREGNVSIRSYQQTVESAEKTDVSDQYINKYFNLSQQIDAYDRQIRELKKSRDGITDKNLLDSINGQIKVLQAQRESLYRQYNDLDDDEDDAKDEQKKTVDSTRRQMQNNADTICMSAENNYISLASMQYSLAQTERSLQQLDRHHRADEKAGRPRHRHKEHALRPAEPARAARGAAEERADLGGQPQEHARHPVRLPDRHRDHHRGAAGRDQ